MPQVGNLMVSVYREESKHLGDLIAAMCAAQAEFLPVALDCDGYRNGDAYKYASIKSIRRSTQAALSKHGLIVHHVYGHSDEGDYVVTVLRHTSDQYICSTLRIPRREDAQDQKSVMTLLCRTAIEGLLGIVTEDDDDAQSTSMEFDAATRELWATNLSMAKASILSAGTVSRVTQLEKLAKDRIAEGKIAPDAAEEIVRLCADRKKSLTKEKTSDRSEGVAGDQGADAAGSGSSSADGGAGRRAAVVG
jgi:hypothetical protein